MDLTIPQLILIGLILLMSSVLQGSVGFASGLFGTPLFMLLGLSLPEAVAISIVSSAVQNTSAAWQSRHSIDYRVALRPMLIRFATLPVGAVVLYAVGQAGKDLATQLVGGVLLAIVVTQWLLRVRPHPRVHVAWEWIAFSLAGFLLGLCGMGGPPMMLWVMAHDWPMAKARAFMFFQFATGMPPQAILLWVLFGNDILFAMLIGLAATPVLLAGIYIGIAISRQIPDRVLRALATLVLVLIGISAVATPFIR